MKSHNYKRICKLGKGSFGDVQLIENVESKKLYALKRLDISNNELPSVLNEVCLLQQLDHPNIIKYHEYFKDTSKFCIVMEYADNGDLNGQVCETRKNKTHLPETTILSWFSQLCLALSYLHKRHVIHRDIKLQNIFLNKEGLIKIGDFGVSKKLENTDDLAKTSLGTPYYISPEICQGKPYNNKSDVWMLGCVLYELMTLERAFNAYSLHTLVKKIVEEGHQKISQKYSEFLKGLIDEMLEKDPEKRPKICEILEKKEIKTEIDRLLVKYPKIYGNFIEAKDIRTRDNKSISFHDYLIKKRNSLADDEKVEKTSINKNPYELLNNEGNNNDDPFINVMTKKNNHNKMATINLKNTAATLHPSSILSRKISLPNEISIKDDYKHEANLKENITIKNKNNLDLPIQAYFPQKTDDKTPNFKNLNIEQNSQISKEISHHLKTPQHTDNKKRLGYPYKRVVNLNLEDSYFQEQYTNKNQKNQLNVSFQQEFPDSNRIDSSRQCSSRQEAHKQEPYQLISYKKESKDPMEEKEPHIKPKNEPQKQEVYQYQIKPIYSVSPKYQIGYKPFSRFEKDVNKENLGYLANRNSNAITKGLQNETNHTNENRKNSFHEMNVSFDEFSKKKDRELKNREEAKVKESTKRSISVHISSKAALENFICPPSKFSSKAAFDNLICQSKNINCKANVLENIENIVNTSNKFTSKTTLENILNPSSNISNFSEFLRKKSEEKQRQQSFLSYLEKQNHQKNEKNTENEQNNGSNQKKHELFQQILLKMLGEKKFNLFLSLLSQIDGKNNKDIDKNSLAQFDEIMGECNKGVVLMLQEMCKNQEHNRCKSVLPTSLLLE